MVQFYISSGVIIASVILQVMLIRTVLHTKNLISENPEVRIKQTTLSSIRALKFFKAVIVLTVLLFLWSLYLVVAYKELFIGIMFLSFLLAVIGLVLLANNLFISVGLKNEVQLAHIKKMDFNFSEESLKYLKKQALMIKLSLALITYTNTLGLYFAYATFNDALWFNAINLGLTMFAYFAMYKSLENQHQVVFYKQKGFLTEEEVEKFLAESKDKYRMSEDDLKNLIDDEKDTKK